jgi:hypothetical protein
MVLTFHADESYDAHGFIFAGWLGEQTEWERPEHQWSRRIEFECRNSRPLNRFHATDCDALGGEYKGWTKEQAQQHVTKLVNIIKRRSFAIVAAGVDLKALVDTFPGDKKDPIAAAYDLSVREVMIQIARGIRRSSKPDAKITIVFHHSRYNGVVERAFDKLKNDPDWGHGSMFVGRTPMCWQDCVPLQAADLLAFDTRRMLYARLRYNSATMRRSLQELTAGRKKSVMARYFDRTTLETLKQMQQRYRHEEGVHGETEQGIWEIRQHNGATDKGLARWDESQNGHGKGGEAKKAEA